MLLVEFRMKDAKIVTCENTAIAGGVTCTSLSCFGACFLGRSWDIAVVASMRINAWSVCLDAFGTSLLRWLSHLFPRNSWKIWCICNITLRWNSTTSSNPRISCWGAISTGHRCISYLWTHHMILSWSGLIEYATWWIRFLLS